MASVGEVNLQQILSQCCRLINLWTNDCDALRMLQKSTDLLKIWKFERETASAADVTDSTVCRLLDSLELVLDGSSLPAPCRRRTCDTCLHDELYKLDRNRSTLLEFFALTASLEWHERATRLVEVCCRHLSSHLTTKRYPGCC